MTDTSIVPDAAPPAGPGGERPAPPPGLRSRAVRASAWALSGTPISMVLQAARSVVLTGLLYPEAFGLMLLVNVVLNGLQMVSDVGISVSIVQHADGDDEEFLQTAWTAQILRGVALWLVCCLIAWPVSAIYEQPELLWLIPAAGFNLVISGLRSTSISTHRRNLKLGPITIFGFGMDVVQLAIVVVVALITRSVWALVIGSLLGSAVYAAASHVLLPGVRHRLAWNRQVASTLIHAGKWIFLGSLLTFLSRKGDGMLLGGLIDIGTLGVYGTAATFAMVPRDIMSGLSGDVLFPAVSEKARTDTAALDATVDRARSMLLRVALLACAGIALGAPVFFKLYDPRYAAAGEMAQWLVVPAWFGVLHVTSGYTLLAVGDNRALTVVNGVTFLLTWAYAFIAHHYFGVAGFIVGTGAGMLFGELMMQRALARHGVHVGGQDLKFTLGVGALALGGVAVTAAVVRALPDTPVWVVESCVAIVWLVPLTYWMGRRVWNEVFRR